MQIETLMLSSLKIGRNFEVAQLVKAITESGIKELKIHTPATVDATMQNIARTLIKFSSFPEKLECLEVRAPRIRQLCCSCKDDKSKIKLKKLRIIYYNNANVKEEIDILHFTRRFELRKLKVMECFGANLSVDEIYQRKIAFKRLETAVFTDYVADDVSIMFNREMYDQRIAAALQKVENKDNVLNVVEPWAIKEVLIQTQTKSEVSESSVSTVKQEAEVIIID